MPETNPQQETTKVVLQKYISLANSSPQALTDDQILSGIPELKAQFGSNVAPAISALRNYDQQLQNTPTEQIGSLNKSFVDSFGKNFAVSQPEVSTSTTEVVQPTSSTSNVTSSTDASKQILTSYIKRANTSPQAISDDEIKSELIANGIPSGHDEIIAQLRAYDTALQNTAPEEIGTLNATYVTNLDNTLKKKDPTTATLQETGIQTSDQLEPSSSGELLPGTGQLQSDSSISGSGQLESALPESNNARTAGDPGKRSTENYINDLIQTPQYTQVQNADLNNLMINVNTGRPFGSTSEIFIDERIVPDLKEGLSKSPGHYQQIENKEAEASLEQKISNMTGLPLDVVQENKGDWALKSKISGVSPGLTEEEIAVRDRVADKHVRDQADQIREKNFDELNEKIGSDKVAEYWNKKSNEISVSYLSENDLAIYDLKQKIQQLESVENRNVQQEMDLKKLKSSLDTAVETKLTGKDLFDDNGAFVLNKKIQIENPDQFTDKVNKYAAIYDDTDKSTLTKERDNSFFQYVYAKQQYESSRLKDESLAQSQGNEKFGLSPETESLYGFMQDRLAYFMGVNRALLLNSDPGTEGEDTFFTGIGEGLKTGLGIASTSESALADRAIQGIQNAGFEITPDQEAKISADFWEKAGTAIGQSIPASVEIGLNIWVGNKVAGALAIPKLAQALAQGSKIKEFGLTLIYESALQGTAFAVSGESFSGGVGEGIGQTIGSALLSRFGLKNKLLNFGVRTVTGAVTETAAEYSGQLLDELEKNGYDWRKAAEETFGKTPEDAWEKLAITYMVALSMGIGGGSQESNLFLKEAQAELKESGSDSPIVAEAIKADVTTPVTEEDITKRDEILEKKQSGEDVTDQELNEAEIISTKEEFQENEQVEKIEASPVIVVNKDGEKEYTFQEGEASGFVSEDELFEKLDNARFVNKIKTGTLLLNVTNPSPEIEAKIKEVFPEESPVNTGAEAQVQRPELTAETTAEVPIIEETQKPVYEGQTENKTETELKTETTPKDGVLISELDNIEKFSVEAEPSAGNIFNKNEAFTSLTNFSKQVAQESGLTGKKLKAEIQTRLEEKFGQDSSVLNDYSEVSDEVVSSLKITKPIKQPKVKKPKVVKDKFKTVADNIRKAKISLTDMSTLSTNIPGALIQSAWNSAVTATALTVETTGNIAQAISDGITALKETEWYKGLSEEGKLKAEAGFNEKLKAAAAEAESEPSADQPTEEKPKEKKRIPETRKEEKVPAGSTKTNPKNKAFSERLGTQTNLKEETKAEVLNDAKNRVQNQKELLGNTKKIFDRIISETSGNYEEVIKFADSNDITPDHRELIYAHVMQHLAELENSSDPAISKAASNRLIELGRIVADRLNASGKQTAAMATVYKNFSMYEFYQKLAVVEKMNERIINAGKENVLKKEFSTSGIKAEATRDLESVIQDIEDNFDELFNDERFEKIISKLQSKIDGRKRPVKNLTKERKQKIEDKKKAALNRFFGRKQDTAMATLPGVPQVGAIIEYAAALIEEGFYRSKDIIAEIKEAFNSRGAELEDNQIKKILEDMKQFREILNSEEVTTRKDSFKDVMSAAVSHYLKEGLKIANMTMNQAIVSSDENIKQIKKNAIEGLKNNFNLTDAEAEAAIAAIDQVFREKAVAKLKQRFDKFYPKVSVKGAQAKKEVDQLVKDVSLGALDTTFEFMNMTFRKYGIMDLSNPTLVKELREKATNVKNAPEGVLRNKARRELETYLHQKMGKYGWMDWVMTRFYGDILSGPITHLKNLKYNTFAIGLAGPISQLYQKGANPISTWKEMRRSFLEVDKKVAAHYLATGNNFIDPNIGPKTYADQLEFNLIKNGWTKLLNLTSTRLLVSSDLVVTRPYAAAVFKNHVKAFLSTEKGLKGRELEKAASEMMGYTEENVGKSSKQAMEDIQKEYGFDPFVDSVSPKVTREAELLLLLRTQELILQNSGIEEAIGTDAWLDRWNGETLQESSDAEAKNLALQGEVVGAVGIMTDLLDKVIDFAPVLRFKIPFTRIVGNLMNTAIKWTPGLGQSQVIARHIINTQLKKRNVEPTSSTTLWLLRNFPKIELLSKEGLKTFNKGYSHRQSQRDLNNMLVITGIQALIYAIMAKDDEDEGLVVTGMLDQAFFKRESITKGTGISPWSIYWRDADGKMSLLTEYKNSAYGYAFAYFGELSDLKRQGEDSAASAWFKSLGAAPFFSADKAALTGIKELWDDLSIVDKYGNNKFTDDKGYTDKWQVSIANFVNSVATPNLFKQSNRIVEQAYGWDAKRATNWWQALTKGLPYMNQNVLESQVDHFGRPIEQKFELGFMGVTGNFEKGFTTLEPGNPDPYYEIYTDRGKTPPWFTESEIPIYTPNYYGNYVKNDAGEKTRISKYEGHVLNALIGKYRKELMDNAVDYDMATDSFTNGLEVFKTIDDEEYASRMRKLEAEAKDRAFKEFFEIMRPEESEVSNEKKTDRFLKSN